MANTSSTVPRADRRASPWALGLLFGMLLLLALPLMGVASGFLDEGIARVLLFMIWAVTLVACGATAARYGASGAIAGGVAGGMLAILIVILQLFRVALRLIRLTYTDLDFTGARLVNLLWTLVMLMIAVAIGALLGWLGGKVSPSPTA